MSGRNEIVAGIDPGSTGALAILYPDGTAEFFDVLMIKVKNKPKPAWQDWQRSWSAALDFAGVDRIIIENVFARPGQGVASMFTFGRTLGFAHSIAVASGAAIQFVTPGVWKGKLGLLNSGKGASREACVNLYPSTAPKLDRVKDDGRAEAVLIAHYGKKFL